MNAFRWIRSRIQKNRDEKPKNSTLEIDLEEREVVGAFERTLDEINQHLWENRRVLESNASLLSIARKTGKDFSWTPQNAKIENLVTEYLWYIGVPFADCQNLIHWAHDKRDREHLRLMRLHEECTDAQWIYVLGVSYFMCKKILMCGDNETPLYNNKCCCGWSDRCFEEQFRRYDIADWSSDNSWSSESLDPVWLE